MNSNESEDSVHEKAVAILVAAGRGLRAGSGPPKQFRLLRGTPLLALTLGRFAGCAGVAEAILVVPDPVQAEEQLSPWLPADLPVRFVRGGETRQASTAAGLAAAPRARLLLIHDGVRPFVSRDLIHRVLQAALAHGAAVPLLPVQESLKRVDPQGAVLETADRLGFAVAQTPQGFRREVLEQALRLAESQGHVGADEAELVERSGHPVTRVEGVPGNLKITTPSDFILAEAILASTTSGAAERIRIGMGYDVHPLVPGRPLVLGGVQVPHPAGPAGHSDGDLVCHAATDAILGAAGLPDIGQLFPDSDPRHRGADSLELLARAWKQARQAGFLLGNLDLVVVAEEPRLAPYVEAMRRNLAGALECDAGNIGIKGKRGEGLGFAGRREGIAAHAVVLLVRAGESLRS